MSKDVVERESSTETPCDCDGTVDDSAVMERTKRVLAVLHHEDLGVDIETFFRTTTVEETIGRQVIICEVCVTVIDTKTGARTTQCKPIPCPGGGKAPTPGPIKGLPA
jgi:hypothetical protein